MTTTSTPKGTNDGEWVDAANAPNPDSPNPDSPNAAGKPSRMKLMAVIAALLLGGGTAGYLTGRFFAQSDEPAAIDQGSFALQGELAVDSAIVNDFVAYVETEAGRPFLFPPVIVAQSDTEFVEGLTELAGEELLADDIEQAARYLQVVHGDSTGAAELEQVVIDLNANGPLGYYDPSTDKIYVPTTGGDTPELRATIVHELVHALDDQYVDLELILDGGPDGELTPEEAAIDRMIIEGRATSVERAWRAENDTPLPMEDLPAELEDVPPALLISVSLPYELGAMYIDGMGGAANTWEVLENRPATSDELLSPEPGTPLTAPSPTAPRTEIDRWDFGAFETLTVLLGNELEPEPARAVAAFMAASGWAGGEAVLSGDDTTSCLTISLVADSPDALATMGDAFATWASEGADRRAEIVGDALAVEGCAPFLS